MKNLTGMWIYQELNRAWREQGEEVPYDRMTEMAAPWRMPSKEPPEL